MMKIFPLDTFVEYLKTTNFVLVFGYIITRPVFEDLTGDYNHIFLKLTFRHFTDKDVCYEFTEGVNRSLLICEDMVNLTSVNEKIIVIKLLTPINFTEN